MSFSLGTFMNDLLKSDKVQSVMNNPIYTAIIIVIVVLIIFYFMFRSLIDEDEPFWPIFIRTGVYSFILVSGFIFLHYKSSEHRVIAKGETKILDQVVKGSMEKNITGDENEVLLHQLKVMTPVPTATTGVTTPVTGNATPIATPAITGPVSAKLVVTTPMQTNDVKVYNVPISDAFRSEQKITTPGQKVITTQSPI